MKTRRKYARSARNLIFASAVVMSAVGLLAACSSSTDGGKVAQNETPGQETPRQAEILHILKHDCGACHGLTRKGGLGPAIRPRDLSDKSAAIIAGIILDGVSGTPMPPWRPYITPDEAIWLATALKQGRGLQ